MKSTAGPRFAAARGLTILLASALSLWSTPSRAQTPPERLSDREVKVLIDRVDEARDKFEGNLDRTLKNSTLPSANGERSVPAVLQDYQDNTKKLQQRFNDSYAAGAEVATVLKQAAAIDRFMQGTSSVMEGRLEWDREAASLKHLATAYGTTFPMPDGATAQRINDKQTAAAAAAIVTAADRLKHDLDNIKTLPKPEKEAAKKDIEALIALAETVKDQTNDGRPATAALRRLIDQAAKVQAFIGTHQTPTAMANGQMVQTSLRTLQQAFGLTK